MKICPFLRYEKARVYVMNYFISKKNYVIFEGKGGQNVAPRLCLVMSVNFSAWNSGGNRCRKKGKKRSSTAGCEKQRVSFFYFFSGTKDLRISRKKSCGRVNSVIAWSSLHPNLHPHESSPVGVSNASCFIFRACAGYNGRHIRSVVRTHLQNREYLWGIRWRRGWKDEKSLANLWRALCFSAKSRIHRECVVRLLKTYVCRAERRAFATMYLTFKCTLRNMKSIGKISR